MVAGFWPPSMTPITTRVVAAAAVAAAITSAVAGGVLGFAIAAASLGLSVFMARRLVDGAHRRFVVLAVSIALLLRVVMTAALHIYLQQRNLEAALFLDDAGYVRIAAQLAAHWHGTAPAPLVDSSVDNNYVRLAGALFYVVGPSVMSLKLVNTLMGVASALLVYRTMVAVGLPSPRTGLVLTLAFPSIVLWSALTLKDTYSLMFSLLAVWSVTEFVRTRRYWPWFAITVVGFLAVENVRAFLFVVLAVAWPIGLIIPFGWRRWRPAALATAISAILLASTSALNYLNPSIITASVYVRQSMAQGAASGFVAPLPVLRAQPCTVFVVTVAGRTPTPNPRRLEVPDGAELAVESPSGGLPHGGQISVRPGDLIITVGNTNCDQGPTAMPPPGGSSTGQEPPTKVVLVEGARNVVSVATEVEPQGPSALDDLIATAAHLPIGLLALLVAPVPLLARSATELMAAPEMLAWYGALVAAAIGLMQVDRVTRARFAYPAMVAVAIALVLSLYEGNLGTLVRHRAMVIPFVLMLSAAGVTTMWHRLRHMRT